MADNRRSDRPSHFEPVAAGSPVACAATLLGSIPGVLLVAPLIRTTFDGLSLPMTAPIMVLVVLSVGAILPVLGPLVAAEPRHWRSTATGEPP